MIAAGTTTASDILHHVSDFISEILAQSDLRKRLHSAIYIKISLSDQIPLKPLSLAAEALDNAISTDNYSIRSSSLRCAEKLLLPLPENPLSSFLLSLVYGLNRQHHNAALCLLDLFHSDPSLTRSEIAPILFEELFFPHFVPIFYWFNEQRSKILTSFPSNSNHHITESSSCDESVVFPCTKSLSKMNIDQTLKIKDLESDYEQVLNENCRAFADYLKQILESKDDLGLIATPAITLLDDKEKWEEMEDHEEKMKKSRTEQFSLPNGRYNPIWAQEETVSVEVDGSCGSKPPPHPNIIAKKRESSSNSLRKFSNFNPSNSHDDSSPSKGFSSESELEMEENYSETTLFDFGKPNTQKLKQTIVEDSRNQSVKLDTVTMEDSDDTPPGSGEKHAPPKDFVCPITCHIFVDPVTLETGQTYERSAIQEWLDRGNLTCPITGQRLQNSQLPKTNYVLKRLIASWLEQNPSFVPDKTFGEAETLAVSTSPVSVISQASIDGNVNELRRAITNLCASEILDEAENAALYIERIWMEENVEVDIQNMLLKPPVINGFVEILVNSVNPRVLEAAIFLLSELGFKDTAVIQTLTRVESDVDCIVALFKKGFMEAVVLIYQLGLSSTCLIEMDMVGSLLNVLKMKEGDVLRMRLRHKSAALILLRKIIGDSKDGSLVAAAMLAENAIESIIGSLKAKQVEERIAAVGILLRCIQEDGKCRNFIVEKAELAPVLESFMEASDDERFEIIKFLSELVKLNRRTFNEQILHSIKDEGVCSTMHSLLIYLQTALKDQCPVVAGLLLQLDILVEPRKMSIYREEAMDVLISCLRNSDSPTAQITAAETIMSLQGRFCSSGRPLTRYFLLERAGFYKGYRKFMQRDNMGIASGEVDVTKEEERAADEWERKMAFVLVSHEFGLLFEELAKGLKSKYAALFSACFVSATWLSHMLRVLPDTGILGAARVCLLKHFISIFTTTTDIEEKVLSLLAISSFIREPEGLQCLSSNMKNILRGLRELKKSTSLAFEILRVLCEEQDSSTELWSHQELVQVDCSKNGEVLSVVYFKDKIFSGHSDGTIKVWSGRGTSLHLIQEVQEHFKGVTSLVVSESEEKLYSGSVDRTIKVWSLSSERIHCIQVHDTKDQIHNLVVSESVACFVPHGAGIRVYSWGGESKLLNTSKYVKCLALVHGKLYCGCHDSSIQEIDLVTGTGSFIHSGSRKLLGKANPVQAIQIHDGQLYSASTTLEGAALKIWSTSNYGVIGSLPSGLDVRAMVVSCDLIYLGGKGGSVEVWGREKQNKIETLQTGRNCKVVCMTLDNNEEVLVVGTSDGRIQAWGL